VIIDSTWILGGIGSLLLGGNLYFIKRLVDKVEIAHDRAKDAAGTAHALMAVIMDLKQEIRDLRSIEVEVAIIRDRLGLRRRKEISDLSPAEDGANGGHAPVG
jgi:hypothetical protein